MFEKYCILFAATCNSYSLTFMNRYVYVDTKAQIRNEHNRLIVEGKTMTTNNKNILVLNLFI